MSDLNLPESLKRLEINSERTETPCNKIEEPAKSQDEAECSLESLSLKAVCPKGNCHCNKKKDKDRGVKKVPVRRPILRRSKLNAVVLSTLRTNGSDGLLQQPQTTVQPLQPARLHIDSSPSIPSSSTTVSAVTAPSPTLQMPQQQRSHCCAVQARLAHPPSSSSSTTSASVSFPGGGSGGVDDTNIDELASYFDLFVHIPKKMSLMAEMMYI